MASRASPHPPRAGRSFREWREELVVPPAAKRAAAIVGLMLLGAIAGTAIAFAGVAAALIVVSVIGCVMCVRDFRVGVLMLIVIMPISSSYMFPHAMFGITGLNPLNLLLAATLGSLILRFWGVKANAPFVPRQALWYIVAMVVAGVIGMNKVHLIPLEFLTEEMIYFRGPWSYLRDMLVKPLFLMLYALLIAAAVARSANPEKFVTPLIVSVWAMGAVVVGFTIVSGVGLSDLAGTYARHFFSAIGMHANDLGRLYAVAYAMLLFIWDRSPGGIGRKLMLLVSMGLVVIALLLTFSRGAFLGFILVNLIYLYTRRSAKMLLLAAIIVPIGLWKMPGAVVDRIEAGWGEGANAVTAGRSSDIWEPLMPEMLDHPFFGNGLGSTMWARAMIDERMLQVGHPHNAFLQVWLDTGLFGTVLIVGFWLYCWRRWVKLGRDARVPRELQGLFLGAAAGLVSFLVAGMAGSSLEPMPEQAFLWLAVGIMFGMQAKLKGVPMPEVPPPPR